VLSYIHKNKHILKIPITKPIFVLGLPRTGTTFLQAILALDPSTRHMKSWEATLPIPPPRKETYEHDPRIEMIDVLLQSGKIFDPDFIEGMRSFHRIRGDAAEEDLLTFHQGLPYILSANKRLELKPKLITTVGFFMAQGMLTTHEGYLDWFYSQENKAYYYKYQRRLLQVLSSKYPPRSHWVLKAPIHSLFLGPLLNEFSDARVIITHRHPSAVLPSWAHFMAQTVSLPPSLPPSLSPFFHPFSFLQPPLFPVLEQSLLF